LVRLIVGLGNPGQEYEKTRHNVGFLLLDYLLGSAGNWTVEPRFNGVLAKHSSGVLLLKPTTYMNNSGMSVFKVAKFYKIEPEEILVVHDELDFQVGIVKLKFDGGHAGHNGIRDIIANLGSRKFYRLRIGIGRPVAGYSVAQYVLSGFSRVDSDIIVNVFEMLETYMLSIADGDIAFVMNALNKKV